MEGESKLHFTGNFIEIPKLFRSDLTGAPFEKCVFCEKYLLEEGTDYLIEKALKTVHGYHAYSTIFEYAMCMPCRDNMSASLSAESTRNIEAYFQKNANLEQRQQRMYEDWDMELDAWINHCVVTGKSVYELSECQLYGHCNGGNLLFYHFPFMISGEAMDDVIKLLSNKTLDDLEGFKDKITGGPPELEELLKSGPRVFV